jgi:hypothetical protein
VTADGIYVGALLSARNLPVHRGSASIWVLGPLAVSTIAYLLAQALQTHLVFRLAAALVAYGIGSLARGWSR